MVTVVMTMQLSLNGVTSLKEKRRILKSMFTRLRNDFNISISEIEDNDYPRFARIAATTVSNSSAYSHQVMQKVVGKIENNPEVFISDYQMDVC